MGREQEIYKNTEMHQPLIRNATVKLKGGSSKGDKVLKFLRKTSSLLAHLIAVIFPVYITYLSGPGSSLFSWHPALMSIAFATFMVEAILVFSPESSLMFWASRKTKVRAHWILQTSCIVCAIIGFFTIFFNKVRADKPHFKTWHGLFGLVTVIYVAVQASFGIFLLYPAKAKNWKLVQLKTYHATFGLLGFTLGCGTLALGLFSNWFTRNVTGFVWTLCFMAPCWLAFVIMNQVTTAYLPKPRRNAI